MEEADRMPTASVDPARAWRRAACMVHTEERRLRDFITEVYKLADAVVLRMQLMGYTRAKDGVLARAIQLRNRLEAEAHEPPLLRAWQRTFDELERPELDPNLDTFLEQDLEDQGLPEAPSHQLRLRFATG